MAEKLSVLFELDLLFNVETLCRFVQLKPLQVKCFEYLLKGKDIVVVTVLPTGFGKFLLFHRLPDFLHVKADNNILYNTRILRFVTFIHLPFSVRSVDHFVASLVFMKGTSCCILRSNLSTVACYGNFFEPGGTNSQQTCGIATFESCGARAIRGGINLLNLSSSSRNISSTRWLQEA